MTTKNTPLPCDPQSLRERAKAERSKAEKDWVAGKLTNEQHNAVLRKTHRMMRGQVA